jgi:transcriptional regulator with XRE-family HTH domain
MVHKDGCRCPDAVFAYFRYNKAKKRGERRVVDATAARRITQGLAFHGFHVDLIAEMAGVSARTVAGLQSGSKPTLWRSKDEALRQLARSIRLDQPRSGWDANRARSAARRNGWVPLAAWDDETIGNPTVGPELGGRGEDIVDEVAVALAVKGERLRLTDSEQVEALRLGVRQGEPLSEVSSRLGINYSGARRLVAGGSTPRRSKQARVEAEVVRVGATHDDRAIAALVGVHFTTVARARQRLAERQQQLAS